MISYYTIIKIFEECGVECLQENPDNKDRTLNLSAYMYDLVQSVLKDMDLLKLKELSNSVSVIKFYHTRVGVTLNIRKSQTNSEYFERVLLKNIKP